MGNTEKNNTLLSFNQLTPGFDFGVTRYRLDAPLVSKYVKAVSGEDSPAKWVPPLAVAAYAMTALTTSVALPPGTIHASQEMEFKKLVPVGAAVDCRGRVAQKVDRGRLHMLIIELEALNEYQEPVLSGKATLILPPDM